MMNPDGLSTQAEKRLAARAEARGADQPEPDWGDPVAITRWRAAQHESWGEGTVAGEVAHRAEEIGGIECLVAGPAESSDPEGSGLTVLHLHAGGFCLGNPGVDAPITSRLARRHRIVSVDYRLAPEYPFPAALDDCEAVYRALLPVTNGPVAVAGVSAGGNLAVALTWRTPDAPPAGLALLCPHVDMGTVTGRALVGYERAYLGGHPAVDPSVSPVDAPEDRLAALPPILLQATTSEPMFDSIRRFGSRAAASGAPVDTQFWDGLWHAWHYHRELPEARDAVDRAADWLSRRGVSS